MILINFSIFHIFSLPNFSKILYSWDSILIDIYFYTSKPYSFFRFENKTGIYIPLLFAE